MTGSFTGVLFLYYLAFLSVLVWPFQVKSWVPHRRNRQQRLDYSSACWPLFQTTEDSALSTLRIPLQRIFNSERQYLFTTRRNVRSYEWTEKEVFGLFESIADLEGHSDELELGTITILAKEMTQQEKKMIGRGSQIYDVSIMS
jgi:hypothetical protein